MRIFKKTFSTITLLLLFLWSGFSQNTPDGQLIARSAVLMEFQTGRTLFEKNADTPIPPASMAKVMTLYLAYDAVSAGILEKNQIITIDEKGSSFSRPTRSSLMLLEEGQQVSVLDLMKGLAVASGNDAAYALADLIGPGVGAFVKKMNEKAHALGLTETFFVDPDGWSELNLVTAREYAVLARNYIRDYPEALTELHSVPFMMYPLPENLPEDRTFQIQVPRKKTNTNRLLGEYEGIDGLKTGYIDEAGFNFTGTAQREGIRLISVIMGVQTDSYLDGIVRRAEEAALLLDYGYENYEKRELAQPDIKELRLWKGAVKYLIPQMMQVPHAFLNSREIEGVYMRIELPASLTAPVRADQKIGTVRYYLGTVLLDEIPLVAGEDIPLGNIFQQARDWMILKGRSFLSQF